MFEKFGSIDGSTYITRRKYPEHWFYVYNALLISKKVLEELVEKKVVLIEMHYLNKEGIEEVFSIPLNRWVQSPISYDNNDDLQIGMNLEDLRKITEDLA